MPIDPTTAIQGLAAVKNTFDAIRQVIGLFKDVMSISGGSDEQKKAIDTALTVASSNAAIAEAQVAQAFGYELCKCEFPPTPMRTIGYFAGNVGTHQIGDPVYECPKCRITTAGPWVLRGH